ncbi:gamma subclass chorismate mutase AroQ [Agreia pratensis]|uniref:gamma subclass chorismate mutase AroQ n=1 Tax=Agreia pratensis TaxID=150121 RepID=UPI00188AB49B|nr:gamma subclass chorismate mutase AroQ [Agreia pratensis]MBF4633978.1 gamma subclass chorismate mutase AroQ [Agreia pratensis]
MPRTRSTKKSQTPRHSTIPRSLAGAVVLGLTLTGIVASGQGAIAADLPSSIKQSSDAHVSSQHRVDDADTLDPIGSLVAQRLALATPVAQSKWLSGKPITDPVREQAVVDEAVALATKDGVDPDLVARVVRAQISASKVVQNGLFTEWKHNTQTAPTEAPDLATIRPQLDSIDTALVTAIGDASAVANDARCSHAVDSERDRTYPGMDSLERKAVRVAWASFCAS